MGFKVFKVRVLLRWLMFVWAEFQVLNYSERLWISDGLFGWSCVIRHSLLGFRGDGIACGREHREYI